MYADYSRDQVNSFLSDLTAQRFVGDAEQISEAFSDDMMLAHMELARLKKARADGTPFVPRGDILPKRARLHPADFL